MTKKVTTLEMETMLMKHFDVRANLIVPNVSWGIYQDNCNQLHECDLLVLSKKDYATEVEIKVSKADLLKDEDKRHGHVNNLIARLYFAVPMSLKEQALLCIPERAGLLVVTDKKVVQVKSPTRNSACVQWSADNRYQLARLGTMRILGLKKKIVKLLKK